MTTKEVTVSGSVGKQVYNDAVAAAAVSGEVQKVRLNAVFVYAPVSGTTVTIRDGNASGDVVLTLYTDAKITDQFWIDKRFDRGMHVKVIGTNSKCYLEIE